MAKKRTQLKVTNSGKKSQKQIFTAVAKVEGVEKMEMDATKSVLIVVGEVEPVPIFKALKKIGVKTEILSVGPPKPAGHSPNCGCSGCRPQGNQPITWINGPQLPYQPSCCNNSYCNNQCQVVGLRYPNLYEGNDTGQCSIIRYTNLYEANDTGQCSIL